VRRRAAEHHRGLHQLLALLNHGLHVVPHVLGGAAARPKLLGTPPSAHCRGGHRVVPVFIRGSPGRHSSGLSAETPSAKPARRPPGAACRQCTTPVIAAHFRPPASIGASTWPLTSRPSGSRDSVVQPPAGLLDDVLLMSLHRGPEEGLARARGTYPVGVLRPGKVLRIEVHLIRGLPMTASARAYLVAVQSREWGRGALASAGRRSEEARRKWLPAG